MRERAVYRTCDRPYVAVNRSRAQGIVNHPRTPSRHDLASSLLATASSTHKQAPGSDESVLAQLLLDVGRALGALLWMTTQVSGFVSMLIYVHIERNQPILVTESSST